MTRLFLDANVYFAGFVSNQGASSLILELARREKLQIYASRLVLHEADRNLRQKTDRKTVITFHRFLQKTRIHVISSPNEKISERCEAVIHPKDAPVLAAAIEAQADFLITLDRKHLLTPEAISLSKEFRLKILTPGDFLREKIQQKRGISD
jgi:putative PIN family toxin of toxin-antitoxin system